MGRVCGNSDSLTFTNGQPHGHAVTNGVSITITDRDANPRPDGNSNVSTITNAGPHLVQGDNDCDNDVDAVDGLKNLQHVAAIPFQQEPDCPDVGEALPAAVPAGDPPGIFADVDCDDDVDAVDALKILQFIAAIPFTQNEPCTEIGQPL